MNCRMTVVVLIWITLAGDVPAGNAPTPWPQWGGRDRNFVCKNVGPIATKWPDAGPKQLWKREIGDGYSAIIGDSERLYTMCRRGDKDAVLAVDPRTGATVWETSYDAPMKPGMQLEFGEGPNSTPLLADGRLFTVGGTVVFNCLDADSGRVLWTHDLMEELQASHLGRGFSGSPLAYDDLVILTVGAPEASVVAFKQETGEVVWKTPGFRPGHSSPILATVHGQEQVVLAMGSDRAGLNPSTGELLWKVTLDQQAMAQMSTGLQVDDGSFFYSAAYGSGSRLIKVSKNEDSLEGKEQWHSRKLKVQHGTLVQFGDMVIGSSGDFGPAFLTALRLADGSAAWRKRGFAKASLLKVDDKLLILDETGVLAIATPTATDLNMHSQAQVLEDKAWTVPTLIGTTLYLRDRKSMIALDLSEEAAKVEAATGENASQGDDHGA